MLVVAGNKGAANLLAALVADGYVLQVGVIRAKSARGRYRLVVRGVDAAILLTDKRR